jgi:hypothetical protein
MGIITGREFDKKIGEELAEIAQYMVFWLNEYDTDVTEETAIVLTGRRRMTLDEAFEWANEINTEEKERVLDGLLNIKEKLKKKMGNSFVKEEGEE